MMTCYVYRSNRKLDTYLYMPKKDEFDDLPEAVQKIFGPPEFSMSFVITPEKKLAQVDAKEVIEKMQTDGYFLQLPRQDFDLEKIEQAIVASTSPKT